MTALTISNDVGNPDIADIIYRAKVFIKWIKADGSVEGTVTAMIDWYKQKAFGSTYTGGSPWCQKVTTAG